MVQRPAEDPNKWQRVNNRLAIRNCDGVRAAAGRAQWWRANEMPLLSAACMIALADCIVLHAAWPRHKAFI